ncbi:MAG: V-type ATP synthase subunit F [Ruminococcus sp.]|nr:V-type ATP synthase subunit F [Ruminococcus sp.]
MYKAAVIGSKESVSGFAALGLSVFPETERDKIARLIPELAKNDFAVIFITEAAASGVGDIIDKYRSCKLPAIIMIPGITGNTGDGMKNLHVSVEKAVGTDILK